MAVSLGVDIGGSGIKRVCVDLETGDSLGGQPETKTPKNSTPEAVVDACREIPETKEVPPQIPVGITIPGLVRNNALGFMANLDQAWVGADMWVLIYKHTGYTVRCVNDAGAAGYAESCFDVAKNMPGLVIVTALGIGIRATLTYNGVLVPNCELGHLGSDGHDAETRASSGVKTAEGLSFREWARRLQKHYSHLEMLFNPDLFAVSGGVSREHEKFLPPLDLKTPITPTQFFDRAGVVGATVLAAGV